MAYIHINPVVREGGEEGNFFDQFDAPASQGAQSPFAGAISKVESGGNYKAVGPATRDGDRALGKYQVMGKNVRPWTKEVLGRELSPTEFMASPEAQDAVFNAKFGSYAKKYGPEGAARAWFAGEGGMNDPNRKDVLGTSVSDYSRKFMGAMGPQQATPQQQAAPQMPQAMAFAQEAPSQQAMPPIAQPVSAPQGVNFFDQFDGPNFNQTFDAAQEGQRPDMQAPIQDAAQAMMRGAQVGPGASVAIEFQNQGSAASQGTTPNVRAQSKNLISTDVFESDSGEVLFRDPQTGEIVPTDKNKHVALRDPADNRVKIFARTPDTDEGVLSSAGRLLMTGMASGAPTARPGLAIPRPVGQGQQAAKAAQELDVAVPRAVTTDSMAVQRTASGLRNVPLAGDPLVKASTRAVEQLGQKATDVAKGYGGGTVVGSGDAAKGAISRYITGTTKQRATALYDKVDDLVDNNKTVPLTTTRGVFGEILSRRANAALGENSKALSVVMEATQRPGLNYQGIKDLRTAVGEMMDGGILPAEMSAGELKQIYGSLSDDLKIAARVTGGPKALAAFERANRYYALVSARRESLAKIIGANGDAPAEKVFDRLVGMASSSSRADIEKLVQARKAIGAEDWNEFASGFIAQMGRAPATRGAPEALQGSDFSPERFLTAYNKLSKEGRALLFRSGGNADLARSLDQIATVSSRFKELQKFSNPSGTAQNVMAPGIAASVIGPMIVGDFITPLKVVGTIIGGRALASALAKPATAAAVVDFSTKYERALKVPSVPKVALLTTASRNLATNLKDIGVTVSPQEFLRLLQSPAVTRADQDEQGVPRPPAQ